MDSIIYIVAVAGPLIAIPQIFKIFIDKNASGVSGITWSAFLIGAFFWLVYGIMHKEKPIIVTNLIWILMTAIIVFGTFIY